MSVPFDRHGRLIVVRANLWGPSGRTLLRMALDTGATATVVRASSLITLSYDPADATEHCDVATGSGIERVPLIDVEYSRARD
jgi:hypothetical protein